MTASSVLFNSPGRTRQRSQCRGLDRDGRETRWRPSHSLPNRDGESGSPAVTAGYPPLFQFYRSELYSLAMRINEHLVRWAMQKFKRLRGQPVKAWAWLDAVRQHQPGLFAHWRMLPRTNGRPVGAG